MNTTLARESRTTTTHPPHDAVHAAGTRRVGLLDRLALRAGLALITWSRRTVRPAPERERLASQHEQRLARLARERAAERTLHLTVPRR
ncbi:hypothetical protein QT381_12610 [Galbitalea sp. SE-J8]|uniref:hypothetical protein n=1 Tax=Galbitalea sp. SE-J8 TaxID=3054952 RepID=UPI00259CC819|nr:hypothetical protein [Galbitalea sp. SE-J8]MDM4763850.1 hypothetical protein [Galbitalea sp. SE-J8]